MTGRGGEVTRVGRIRPGRHGVIVGSFGVGVRPRTLGDIAVRVAGASFMLLTCLLALVVMIL